MFKIQLSFRYRDNISRSSTKGDSESIHFPDLFVITHVSLEEFVMGADLQGE